MPSTKTGTSEFVSGIDPASHQVFAEELADMLHHQQRSALVICHMLTLQTIAGAQMMERTIGILEVGIGFAQREVQRDPPLVGQIVHAVAQLFQLGQARIALDKRPD